jgi:hypothetical protein
LSSPDLSNFSDWPGGGRNCSRNFLKKFSLQKSPKNDPGSARQTRQKTLYLQQVTERNLMIKIRRFPQRRFGELEGGRFKDFNRAAERFFWNFFLKRPPAAAPRRRL